MFLLIPTGTSRLYHEKSILQMNAAPNQPGLLNRRMNLSHSQKYAVDPKAEDVLASLQSCKENNNNNRNNINNSSSNNNNKILLMDASEILLGSKN